MSLQISSHPVPLTICREHVGSKEVPALKDESSGTSFFLLKDVCGALGVAYGRVRGILHRRKAEVSTLVLSGAELKEFKATSAYAMTASHLCFVEEGGLSGILQGMGHHQNGSPLKQTAETRAELESENDRVEPDVSELVVAQQGSPSTAEEDRSTPETDDVPLGLQFRSLSPPLTPQSQRLSPLMSRANPGTSDSEVIDHAPIPRLLATPPTPGNPQRTPVPVIPESNIRPSGSHAGIGSSSEGAAGHQRGVMPDVDNEDLSRGIKSVLRFKCYTLQSFEMTPLNHLEFHGLRAFFSVPYERRRGHGRPWNKQTIAKSRERICGFLGWLKESGRSRTPSFEHFEDVDWFLIKYVDGYLSRIRGLSPGSLANHITSAIDVLRYRLAENEDPSNRTAAADPNTARLMRARNRNQTLAERDRNDKDSQTPGVIIWEQFLEAVHQERLALKTLWGTSPMPDISRELAIEVQKYVALTFYACMPPARSKEVRLLLGRLLSERESRDSLLNHISTSHGRHVAVISDYKNSLSNGQQDRIELPNDEEVLIKYLLWLMDPRVWEIVTGGKPHGFLFCKRNGDSFEDARDWTAYISGIVEQRSGISNIGPNALRHAFATFIESSDGEDQQRLRESASSAMRHTVRMQQSVYNNV
ncbi:uncharacterized protein EV422DRAFT_95895 [Fimicolochytrium jonesii]|uniref:uncharacterized protein n=1 Tax=Fimicolochytrium jonesii TaxID=1396493 RepID=UPI0022FEF278|nr:uncharacterized protein EV422DRAFT_95895 [Fimicolochytrium jonesii]KAI8820030.1 hypothetical protein EV422DRAFT_95895 [Fimicolochytrium jonesii]